MDASIISAPSSTKNREQARDPDMHQTKTRNQWYFGMKLHIGVDSKTRLVHSAVATAANVHNSQVLDDLLHGNETRVWGDSADACQHEVRKQAAPGVRDFTQCKSSRHQALSAQEPRCNRTKSRVRSRVEHVFHVLKCRFGMTKVRYRGLEKNAKHLFAALALVNLVIA